jgi:uncharacterized protein YcnI
MIRFTPSVAAVGAGIVLALAAPLAASAHVSVDPAQAEVGAYTLITLRVPNESDTAGTNRVEVSLPTDTPFTSVRSVPVPGWTAEFVRETLPEPVTVGESEITEAVTTVIWTADPGSEIGAGQLQLFPLSVGPVPDVGSLPLPTDQGYTDGTTVSWSGTDESAEHPAPVLFVGDAPVDHHAEESPDAADMPAVTADPEHAAPDVLARVLGIGGLVVGAVGIVIAVTSRRRAQP